MFHRPDHLDTEIAQVAGVVDLAKNRLALPWLDEKERATCELVLRDQTALLARLTDMQAWEKELEATA